MSFEISTQLGTPLAFKLLRAKHYIEVYNLALKVTSSPDAAKELAERVFENAASRFANRPIPSNWDMYLAAQVYLLYSLKDSLKKSSVSTASIAYFAAPGQTTPPESITDDAEAVLKFSSVKIEPSLTQDSVQPTNASVLMDESSTISLKASTPPTESPAAKAPSSSAITPDSSRTPSIIEAVYDRKLTEFWVPGIETKHSPLMEATQDDFMEDDASHKGEEPHTTSVALSILNVLLVLGCLASFTFLLTEMNVLLKSL